MHPFRNLVWMWHFRVRNQDISFPLKIMKKTTLLYGAKDTKESLTHLKIFNIVLCRPVPRYNINKGINLCVCVICCCEICSSPGVKGDRCAPSANVLSASLMFISSPFSSPSFCFFVTDVLSNTTQSILILKNNVNVVAFARLTF